VFTSPLRAVPRRTGDWLGLGAVAEIAADAVELGLTRDYEGRDTEDIRNEKTGLNTI